jgi:protein-S-isoprenylcysteine O-methyltransferase Ste14
MMYHPRLKMSKHGHEHLTGEMPGSHNIQIILMLIFFGVWITDSFLLRVTTFLSGPITNWFSVTSAIAVLVVALYLMRASHKDLFDAEIEHISTSGIYGRVRHPMYLGTLFFYLGLAISTLSLASVLVWLSIAIIYNRLADYEERLLEERFGEEFLEYERRVGKWVPKPETDS